MGKRRDHEDQRNFDLPKDLCDELDAFAAKTKTKRKIIAELALRTWLNDRKSQEAHA